MRIRRSVTTSWSRAARDRGARACPRMGLRRAPGRAGHVEELARRLEDATGRPPQVFNGGPKQIERVAVITGGAAKLVPQVAAAGYDAFVTGEAAEPTMHRARELGTHFLAGGHYATETFGIKALAETLAGNSTWTGSSSTSRTRCKHPKRESQEAERLMSRPADTRAFEPDTPCGGGPFSCLKRRRRIPHAEPPDARGTVQGDGARARADHPSLPPGRRPDLPGEDRQDSLRRPSSRRSAPRQRCSTTNACLGRRGTGFARSAAAAPGEGSVVSLLGRAPRSGARASYGR